MNFPRPAYPSRQRQTGPRLWQNAVSNPSSSSPSWFSFSPHHAPTTHGTYMCSRSRAPQAVADATSRRAQILVTGNNVEVTEPLKEYVEKRMANVLDKVRQQTKRTGPCLEFFLKVRVGGEAREERSAKRTEGNCCLGLWRRHFSGCFCGPCWKAVVFFPREDTYCRRGLYFSYHVEFCRYSLLPALLAALLFLPLPSKTHLSSGRGRGALRGPDEPRPLPLTSESSRSQT